MSAVPPSPPERTVRSSEVVGRRSSSLELGYPVGRPDRDGVAGISPYVCSGCRFGQHGHGRVPVHIFGGDSAARSNTVGVMARKLLLAVRPPKPVSRMTDEERHAWAVEIFEEFRRRMPSEPRS